MQEISATPVIGALKDITQILTISVILRWSNTIVDFDHACEPSWCADGNAGT
jgi:hypothetical protein